MKRVIHKKSAPAKHVIYKKCAPAKHVVHKKSAPVKHVIHKKICASKARDSQENSAAAKHEFLHKRYEVH